MPNLGFSLDDIKYGVPERTYQRALKLYQEGKVTKVREAGWNVTGAVVLGTHPYRVVIDHAHYEVGECSCYVGQQDELCKHMVALALHMALAGKSAPASATKVIYRPQSSGIFRDVTPEEIGDWKYQITQAIKYIKPYRGPSRTWFAYQDSLAEGCIRLSNIIAQLPINFQTATLLVDLCLRLDRKLQNGVDDSDGAVGDFVEGVVDTLENFAQVDPRCLKSFHKLRDRETVWGWEERLIKLI